MKSSRCISSPVSALARVFLPGPGNQGIYNGPLSVPPFLAPRSFQVPASRRYAHQRPTIQRPQTNGISTARSAVNVISSDNSSRGPGSLGQMRPIARPISVFRPGSGGRQGSKPGRLPRDREISDRYVILRQEDGSLSAPQPTSAIMARLNPQLESLVMLALPRKQDSEDAEDVEDGEKRKAVPRFPICKIVDRVAERKAEYEKTRELRRKKTLSKELELNWAIDTHDLEHRMGKLREFLERGLRVEVSMMRKGKGKGRRHATQEEAAELLRRVRETVATVPGARETKPMEGELLRVAKLVVDGPARKKEGN
ncbi:translation initiation factor [Grosmannia clavigera kw1407]|uniref:Translation initiation factor n=1 Tax=Grosmannia clavigera (strain kw1407 / UAMH 11150) TaxID=655863 RepID=F0XFQ3_GROCL|nr:translation initiation factor [Grosmannia clavigera kw1407]EFX04180.1 translation initiation factor [Grosmannia clavigera kw1407]